MMRLDHVSGHHISEYSGQLKEMGSSWQGPVPSFFAPGLQGETGRVPSAFMS